MVLFLILSVLLSADLERNIGLPYAEFFTLDVNKQCNVVFSFRASIAKTSTTLFKMPTFCAFSSPAPAIPCPPPEEKGFVCVDWLDGGQEIE